MSYRSYYHYDAPRPRTKLYLAIGFVLGMAVLYSLYEASMYFSSDESCMMCHVHPHVERSWRLSSHVNNGSGVTVHCVDCHLPPKHQTVSHFSAKISLGTKDLWSYITKDSADFNWEETSTLERAVKYIPNASCKECHRNLFPSGITDDGITAHLYYESNEEKLDLQCISCHLDAGHYNPKYAHGKLTGVLVESGRSDEAKEVYTSPTAVTSFADYVEQIPGTSMEISMKAIKGGTFKMGSSEKESFHRADESPIRTVTVRPFFMAEVETTWSAYWSFYAATMSEGRTPPERVYANNSNPLVDAISGPTPPFGFPDQGWGYGERPAITLTHYAAETYCLWLSKQTGKRYRLPTEAEWEYAARGGTTGAYFFSGDPREYSDHGFWRRFISARTDSIGLYIIYNKNSHNRTQEPSMVRANPFGLRNMLGNVMEYCADRYDAEAYGKGGLVVSDPLVSVGEEWVVRGGHYGSDASEVRVSSRDHSRHEQWLRTDPQQPKSIWWYSDIRGIGFRVVCEVPSEIEPK